MELVDSHCHLDDAQFEADREQVIQRARASGLKWMLTIGTGDGPPGLDCAIRVAENYPFVLATVGVHPNDVQKINNLTFQDLESLLRHPKARAVGEIGLDYHWSVPKEEQLPVFVQQLEMAASAKMPVVIHTRDAWNDTLDVLRRHWAPTGLPCIMHCFTGNSEQARECINLDFYVAFGGVATFPKGEDVREAARLVPANRLLLETDCPYLAPVPYRGKRNEPAYVAYTAGIVARAREVTLEQLAAETTANFERVFVNGPASYTEVSAY